MTDKMLSEAEIDAIENSWAGANIVLKLCAQAKLAIPKPRQDAGRVEYDGQTAQEWAEAWDRENDRWQAIVMHHEELETAVKKLLKFLKMRYPNMNTKFPGLPEVEKIMAQTGDNPALTLEAKPQTDNRGLVEAVEYAIRNYGHPSPYEPGRHDPGWSIDAWAKREAIAVVEKLAQLAQADAKEGKP